MFIIYALPSYRRLSAPCNWLPVRLWGMKAFKSASQLQSTFNMQQSWQSSRAACPGDISDVSGWEAECRLCRHIVSMMFNVIVIMSLAGRHGRERNSNSSGLLQLCQLCLIAGAWQVSAPFPPQSHQSDFKCQFSTPTSTHTPLIKTEANPTILATT